MKPAIAARNPKGMEHSDWEKYWVENATLDRGDSHITVLHRRYFNYSLGGKSIVQLGCGDMSDTPRFSGARFLGIDISDIAIGMARQNLKHWPADNTYAFKSGVDITAGVGLVESGSCDLVLSIETMHLMGSALPFVVQEAGRILRPGGVFQFDIIHSDMRVHPDVEWMRLDCGILFELKEGNAIACSEGEIRQMIRDGGMEIEKMAVWGDMALYHCIEKKHAVELPEEGWCPSGDTKVVTIVRALKR
jgi:SAM-dependent methyltransferase